MKRAIVGSILVLALSLAVSGCTYVRSAAGGNTSMANDAWFTQTTGLGPLMVFSTSVYYCPPMGSDGASVCTEAEMIEDGAPAAQPAAAAEPAPVDGGDMGGEQPMDDSSADMPVE